MPVARSEEYRSYYERNKDKKKAYSIEYSKRKKEEVSKMDPKTRLEKNQERYHRARTRVVARALVKKAEDAKDEYWKDFFTKMSKRDDLWNITPTFLEYIETLDVVKPEATKEADGVEEQTE